MAKHDGLISLSGKLGDLVFVKGKKTNSAKSKAHGPIKQTKATRNSSTDFGKATNAAARIRKAIAPVLVNHQDDTLINRLNRRLIEVFVSIPRQFAGKKQLVQGNVAMIQGFKFNDAVRLDHLLLKPPYITIFDEGKIAIAFDQSEPETLIDPKKNTEAGSINLIVYNMDLDGAADETIAINELVVPFSQPFRDAKIEASLNFDGHRLVLVALGIHYLQGNGLVGNQRMRTGGIIYAQKFKNGHPMFFEMKEQKSIAPKPKTGGLDWQAL